MSLVKLAARGDMIIRHELLAQDAIMRSAWKNLPDNPLNAMVKRHSNMLLNAGLTGKTDEFKRVESVYHGLGDLAKRLKEKGSPDLEGVKSEHFRYMGEMNKQYNIQNKKREALRNNIEEYQAKAKEMAPLNRMLDHYELDDNIMRRDKANAFIDNLNKKLESRAGSPVLPKKTVEVTPLTGFDADDLAARKTRAAAFKKIRRRLAIGGSTLLGGALIGGGYLAYKMRQKKAQNKTS